MGKRESDEQHGNGNDQACQWTGYTYIEQDALILGDPAHSNERSKCPQWADDRRRDEEWQRRRNLVNTTGNIMSHLMRKENAHHAHCKGPAAPDITTQGSK